MTAVPKAAVDLAKRFEGFHRAPKHDPGRAHPYVCPAGYWTIGYGRLCDPRHPPISETQAEAYLAQDLMTAMQAIIDFTFNLGAGRLQTSTLRRRVNQRDWPGAASELKRWVYGGGVVLPGLVIRRAANAALIQSLS